MVFLLACPEAPAVGTECPPGLRRIASVASPAGTVIEGRRHTDTLEGAKLRIFFRPCRPRGRKSAGRAPGEAGAGRQSHFFVYLSSKTIYENDWERHPQRVLISLLFPIWHTAIVSVIHYHGVHTLSMLLSSTSLVSLCRCPTPYRVSANLQAGLSCTTKIVTLHGKVYRMANWPSTIQVI